MNFMVFISDKQTIFTSLIAREFYSFWCRVGFNSSEIVTIDHFQCVILVHIQDFIHISKKKKKKKKPIDTLLATYNGRERVDDWTNDYN